jgi:hypothetical protein
VILKETLEKEAEELEAWGLMDESLMPRKTLKKDAESLETRDSL